MPKTHVVSIVLADLETDHVGNVDAETDEQSYVWPHRSTSPDS